MSFMKKFAGIVLISTLSLTALAGCAQRAGGTVSTDGSTSMKEVIGALGEAFEGKNQGERDVEALCLKLLLQQQPVARDLRQISAAMKLITDMERIGDQASDIAEIVEAMLSEGYVPEDVGHICKMAAEVIQMVTGSVDAYVRQDAALAHAVIAGDDVVDRYFTQVRSVLIQKIAEDPASGERAMDLLMIDKYLERIGDHAVNIAEWVIFAVTGEHKGTTL